MHPTLTLLALAALAGTAQAQDYRQFESAGLRGSEGIVVRVSHPSGWKQVPLEDEMALAELRGPVEGLTGILQIGRGGPRPDVATLCRPERARTMLLAPADEDDARITDVVARMREGRPGFEVRYERKSAGTFLVVRSAIVCLKDTRLVVSCGAIAERKAALDAIQPVCGRVLESLRIAED
jgi:hypothetical protein